MAIPSGHRPYGGTPGDYVATVATVAGVSVVVPPTSGNTVTIYGSRTGSALTDLYDDDGNQISSVPVSASGLLGRFWARVGEVWVPVTGGRAKLVPNDAGTVQGVTSVASGDITDATAVGKAGLTAPTQAAARAAIGAGEPVTLPTEIASADTDPTATNTGLASGRRLAAAHVKNAIAWGSYPVVRFNAATGTWPARPVIPGYSGPVIYDCAQVRATVPSPTDRQTGDMRDRYVSA